MSRADAHASVPDTRAVDSGAVAAVAPILAIVALATLLYSDTLRHPLVLDDIRNIANNPAIRWQEISLENLRRAAFESPTPRAVANVSFALSYWMGGGIPASRVTNVAIHAGNGLLVYALALALYRRSGASGGRGAALFAALLFVAHPLQTQSVTYLVQRMNSMAAGFHLAALLCYLRGRGSGETSIRNVWWGGGVALWLLGVGSKETAAVLPFTVWLTEWAFYRDFSRAWLLRWLPALGVLGVGFLAVILLHPGGLALYEGRGFTPGERLLTQARAVWIYLLRIFVPDPSQQNLVYDLPISKSLVDPITTALGVVGLGGLVAAAIALARRQRLVSFAIAWFLLHLAIESSLLPLAMVYEHRTYLPMVGIAIALPPLVRTWIPARAAAGLGVVVVIGLGLATHARNQIWRDPVLLWSDVVAKSPTSSRAYDELGLSLTGVERHEEAFAAFLEALRLDPPKPEPHLHLGYTLVRLGYPEAGMRSMRDALALNPSDAPAHHAVGRTLLQAGQIEPALEHLRRAVEIDPSRAHHHEALGVAEDRLGRSNEAASHYAEAIRLDPRHADAHGNLGMLWLGQGRHDEAIGMLELALRYDPGSVTTRNNLAWVLATSQDPALRDPERAVRLAEEALDAEGDGDPELLDTLAAAHASAGRFEEAARIAARAAERAETLGDLEGARRMRESERHYREGRVSVESPPPR